MAMDYDEDRNTKPTCDYLLPADLIESPSFQALQMANFIVNTLEESRLTSNNLRPIILLIERMVFAPDQIKIYGIADGEILAGFAEFENLHVIHNKWSYQLDANTHIQLDFANQQLSAKIADDSQAFWLCSSSAMQAYYELSDQQDSIVQWLEKERGHIHLFHKHPQAQKILRQWEEFIFYNDRTQCADTPEKNTSEQEGKPLDRNSWKLAYLRPVSYAFQKVMYDSHELVSSFMIESVNRSAKHNFKGSIDEFRRSSHLTTVARDEIHGVIPRKTETYTAQFLDGILSYAESLLLYARGVLGLAKTAVSAVAHPIYRFFGGKPSTRDELPGKRASIVIIDSRVKSLSGIFDVYGEALVRYQLKSYSEYYCFRSSVHPVSIDDCIDQMPDDIEFVDLYALTHSGGMEQLESHANKIRQTTNAIVDMMISIGCSDPVSFQTHSQATMGQQGVSWAVHFYLANLISKRLRGIPLQEAAMQAYWGSFVPNVVNPISIGSLFFLKYRNSRPVFQDHLIDKQKSAVESIKRVCKGTLSILLNWLDHGYQRYKSRGLLQTSLSEQGLMVIEEQFYRSSLSKSWSQQNCGVKPYAVYKHWSSHFDDNITVADVKTLIDMIRLQYDQISI